MGLFNNISNTIFKYMTILEKHPKHILGFRIGALFTLPVLGAVVRAAAIVNFFYGKSLIMPIQ